MKQQHTIFIALYLLIVGILFCCKGNSDLSNFKVTELEDNKFIIRPNDTLVLDKPMLKFFEGTVENKHVQFWLRYSIPEAEELALSYEYLGIWYMEGNNSLTSSSFKPENGYYTAIIKGSENDSQNSNKILYRLFYTAGDNEVIVKKDSVSYILKESSIRFEAYDQLGYENIYCINQDKLNSHWRYDFSYVLKESPEDYENLKTKMFIQDKSDYNPSEIVDWSHGININTSPSNEKEYGCSIVCIEMFHWPVYLDSVMYIIVGHGYLNWGSPRGVFLSMYYNFDMKTGNQIKLEELLDMDEDSFKDYYYQKLQDEFGEEKDFFIREEIYIPSSFYIIPTGIYFVYYNVLSSEVPWNRELYLSYSELNPYLKKQYYN